MEKGACKPLHRAVRCIISGVISTALYQGDKGMCHVITGNCHTFIACYSFFGTQPTILAHTLVERCAFICVPLYKLETENSV